MKDPVITSDVFYGRLKSLHDMLLFTEHTSLTQLSNMYLKTVLYNDAIREMGLIKKHSSGTLFWNDRCEFNRELSDKLFSMKGWRWSTSDRNSINKTETVVVKKKTIHTHSESIEKESFSNEHIEGESLLDRLSKELGVENEVDNSIPEFNDVVIANKCDPAFIDDNVDKNDPAIMPDQEGHDIIISQLNDIKTDVDGLKVQFFNLNLSVKQLIGTFAEAMEVSKR